MLMQARVWLMLLLCSTGSYGATVGHTEQGDIQATSGGKGDEAEVGDVAVKPIGPPAHSAHATEEIACNDDQPAHTHAVDDFVSALNHVGEAGSPDFERFGLCSQHDAVPNFQYLTESVHRQQKGLKGVQATEVDIWEVDKEGEIILTLKFPRYIRPTSPASMMLLFNVESKADGLTIKFDGHFLHPVTQTVCISKSTRFFVLTGGQRKSHMHTHLKLRLKVEPLKADGQKPSLSELQKVLMRTVEDSNATMRPLMLFVLEGSANLKYHGIPVDQQPSSSLPPSKTFLFLCELQKFLMDVLPQKEPPESQEEESGVSLDTLHSLPPLTLGGSSSQSLLSGLMNSSTPIVFVFPQHQQILQTHRVELNLEPPLLSVLRLRLDEAMAQVKKEEAGQKMIDRLQRLSEMSALPSEGKDGEAITTEHKEAQYRSVLLLKALQTVLGIWEVERAQRAARANEDGSTGPKQCRIQSMIVSLRKYFLEPSTAKINNCEGSCTFPISTSSNNHVILLISHIQDGHPVERSPCCVPVEYDDLCVFQLESQGTVLSCKTNVVATRCECR
nr:muellerian-inhibiting factor [Misgurnus anguillicaudatus]